MTETDTAPRSTAASEPTTEPGDRADHKLTAKSWLTLTLLPLTVLVTGAFVGLFGPLFAIACGSCQDGIRSPLRFDGLLLALAFGAVPLTTLASIVGIYLARRGARAGGIGLAVLGGLFLLMLFLGQFTS